MDILLTICARGGSKGVPGKNLKTLNNKPLIAHSIEQAKNWGSASDIIVSTDSQDIAEIARQFNISVPFLRPDNLAKDDSPKLPVIQHALKFMENNNPKQYELVIDLDPTSPLRNTEDIEACYQKIKDNKQLNNVFTVCEADKNPYFNMVELDEKGHAHLCKQLDNETTRRQDAPPVYEMNASIYAYRKDFLLNTTSIFSDKTGVVVMPPERSVDIDRPIDFKFVEFLMEENKK
jgi:N-acylneuraminate cytidylyltransferase/CMP-N,N'-diacetyllegionaminic acid synthase